MLLLLPKLKGLVSNPLNVDLRPDLDARDYESRVAFIEQFHEDFARVVDAYVGRQKVYVFVDDLDRCEVPKAADLMQALNLMISDVPQLIFVVGMDREKVAAGLAVKYEKLLPYLAPGAGGGGASAFDPVLGLEYGYNFIEKFIQLPFHVPQASEEQLEGFLKRLSGSAPDEGRPAPEPSAPPTARGRTAEARVTENSRMVEDVLRMVAPAFEYNPRRMKQFINAFRLKTFIASRIGLFDAARNPQEYDPLTPEQLGKFVALSLRWPLLLADLDADRRLLAKLQKRALQDDPSILPVGTSATESRWLSRPQLVDLLRAGCYDEGGKLDPEREKIYSLERLSVNDLLQVCPIAVPPPPARSAPPEERQEPDMSRTYSGGGGDREPRW